MTTELPLWATVVAGVAAAVLTLLGTLVTQAVLRRNTKETNRVNRVNARESSSVAAAAVDVDRSRSDRDLILQALELARSDDGNARRQGRALLEGLARMPHLSPDDAVLIKAVTRPLIGGILEQVQQATAETGHPPVFYLDESSDVGEPPPQEDGSA